jgi:hypothetical protein
MFEYEYLIRRDDKSYIGWEFKHNLYYDRSLLDMLNYVGSRGFELVAKENDFTYILKRRIDHKF